MWLIETEASVQSSGQDRAPGSYHHWLVCVGVNIYVSEW